MGALPIFLTFSPGGMAPWGAPGPRWGATHKCPGAHYYNGGAQRGKRVLFFPPMGWEIHPYMGVPGHLVFVSPGENLPPV